jgi:hypothetical protein
MLALTESGVVDSLFNLPSTATKNGPFIVEKVLFKFQIYDIWVIHKCFIRADIICYYYDIKILQTLKAKIYARFTLCGTTPTYCTIIFPLLMVRMLPTTDNAFIKYDL